MIRFYLNTFSVVLNVVAAAFCIVALHDYGFGYVFAWGLAVSLAMLALSCAVLLRCADQLDREAEVWERDHTLTPIEVRVDKSWMNLQ